MSNNTTLAADQQAFADALGITPEPAKATPAAPTGNPLIDLRGTRDFEEAPASRAAEEAAFEQENAELRRTLTGRDFFSNVVGNDFALSALIDAAHEQGFKYDESYTLPELDSDQFKALTRDIPSDYWDAFEGAFSRDHADWIAQKTRRELQAERELAAYGGQGIAGRIAINLLDPVGVAIGVASGGIGWASKGTRLARTIKAAGLAGAENAGLQALLSDQRAAQDGWDAANAAFGGMVLGGLAGRFLSPRQRDELTTVAHDAQRQLDGAETDDAVSTTGAVSNLAGTKWGDSFGAARVDESRLLKPLRNTEDAEPAQDVGQSVFAGARIDFASILRGDSDPLVRGTVGLMVGEPVGVKSGVNHIGASEVAQRLNDTWLTKFYRVAEPAYQAWAKAKGYGSLELQSREVRDEFMTAVGRYVRGSITDADENVKALASIVRENQAEILKRAKRAALDGFEDVDENPNYLSRVFNLRRFQEWERRFGTEKVGELLEDAIGRKLRDAFDERTVKAIAKGYLKRLKMQAAGFEQEMLNGVRLTDVDYVRGLLNEVGTDSDTVEYVAGQLRRSLEDRGTGGASVKFGKRRVSLDETARYTVQDNSTGAPVEVGIDELFENNVEKLFTRYTRSMSGHIGLAEVANIKGKRDFERVLNDIRGRYEHAPDARRKEIERVLKTAKDVQKLVTGLPLEDASDWHRYSSLARDLNFSRTMNQVGFAQITDVAGWLAGGYARQAMRHMPELRQIMSRAKDGTLSHELADELEVMLSVGTDYRNGSPFTFGDEMFADGFAGTLGKVHHGVRVLGRGTQRISGMKFINELNQRMAGLVVAQKLSAHALGALKIPAKRLADLGLTDEMMGRIRAQLERHSVFVDANSGRKLRAGNFNAWDDWGAREAMLNAAHREARRIVQEEDLGDTFALMHKSLGKVLFQFRRFAIAAYTKQLLKGIHMRDAQVATHWAVAFAAGGAAFTAQMGIKLASRSEEDRNRIVENYGGWGGMFIRAGLSRANFSSVLPGAIDSVAALTVGEHVFNTRTSGLDSNFLTGNPTYDLVVKGIGRGVLSGPLQAVLRGDRQYTEGDLRALRSLLPFQNMVGANFLFDAMVEGLPEKDEDDDRESVDWF